MGTFLSRHHCGFRNGYRIQQCLLVMFEKWKAAAEIMKKIFGELLTNLSKALDYLQPDGSLEKMHAYGFSIRALRLV